MGFDHCWNRFETALRQKLVKAFARHCLTWDHAGELLRDEVDNWFSPYHANGKWLAAYTRVHPAQGREMADILRRGLTFGQRLPAMPPPRAAMVMRYAVPAAGALLGYGIATMLLGAFFTRCIAAAVPAAALYQIIAQAEQGDGILARWVVEGYMKQLAGGKAMLREAMGDGGMFEEERSEAADCK